MLVANQHSFIFLFLAHGLDVVFSETRVRHLHLHVLVYVHHFVFVRVLDY